LIARQQAHARRGSGVVLAIVPLPGDQPVGMVGLFGFDEPGSTAQFGYRLLAEWRGRGLASDAVRLLAEWGFTHRQLIAVHIDREPANRASERVAEKLGAVVTGSRSVPWGGVEVEFVRHTLRGVGGGGGSAVAASARLNLRAWVWPSRSPTAGGARGACVPRAPQR
jgi:RimJ/RimL family protein N-acetyltransferase